jgi:hypothetical protein
VAVILAPFVGEWVYAAAGVIVIGSLPIPGLNIVRVVRREWRRHQRLPLRAVRGPGAGANPANGEGRNRTGDTTVFSRVLYQLSYLARRAQCSRARS